MDVPVYNYNDGEKVLGVDVLQEWVIEVPEYQSVAVLGEVARVEEKATQKPEPKLTTEVR